MSAIFSACAAPTAACSSARRAMAPMKATDLFVMHNPGTADANLDDPTIRRCRGFAKLWDCNGLAVANLYALRSSAPKGRPKNMETDDEDEFCSR